MTSAAFETLAEAGTERAGPGDLLCLVEVDVLTEAVNSSTNGVAGLVAIECRMTDGAAPVTLWDPIWSQGTPATDSTGKPTFPLEATLQQALLNMETWLNAQGRLHWDFGISDTPTLGKLKPDGHGRLQADILYRTSKSHHGVVVEVKTNSTIASVGRGERVVAACALFTVPHSVASQVKHSCIARGFLPAIPHGDTCTPL